MNIDNDIVKRVYGVDNPWGMPAMIDKEGWIDIHENGEVYHWTRDFAAEREHMKDPYLEVWAKFLPRYKQTKINGDK